MQFPQEQQNQNQGMGIEHHLLPSGQHQCRRSGKNDWRCQELALPGIIYCQKHRLEQDLYNQRRRIARPKKGNHFLTDPVLPSGERQCRRNGKGWRCSHLAPPSKIYCQKHELEQNANNEKKKKERRKRKDRGLTECDEMMKSSGRDCSTVSKRAREKVEGESFEDVGVKSLKRDSGKDVASEETLFPVNEGVVDEHADKNLSIAQIDSVQSLCVTLEDHQVGALVDAKASTSTREDNDDNQVIPVDPITRRESTVDSIDQPQSSNEVDDSLVSEFIDNERVLPLIDNQLKPVYPITTGESTVESVEQPQSLNEVEDSHDFEFTDDEGVLPTLDIICSPFQQQESPLPLENVSSFVKTSHLWKQIYSMETFKHFPQHPHFRPLENISKAIREGKAMGLMLIFDQLMETTLRAQIDITESVLINKLNALAHLEQYGFTVQPLRSRLEKLLKIKKDYIQINESFKTAEEELTNEKRHFNELKESISQLNMKLQQLSAEKEMNDVKLLELQRKKSEVEEKIQHIQVEFDRVVATFGRNLGY